MNDNVRLLLFDIDGTLLWPRGAGRASTRLAMLDVFGTTGNLETHSFGGKTDWLTLTELLLDTGYSAEEIQRRLPDYARAMRHHLTQIIGNFPVEACPGALEVVQMLRRYDHVLLGLVTGNVASTAPIKLSAAGFDPAWFPVGAYGDESINRDDLPALALERAVRYWKRPIAPEQVIVIGDTPSDISCARALGAVAVAVCTGFASCEELKAARPDYMLAELTELFQIFSF